MIKILVVDDVLNNRLYLIEVLEILGYECLVARDGKEAINILNNNYLDVILMDIEMPIMNGIDATNHIRNMNDIEKSKIPVFAVTCHDESSMPEQVYKTGFTGVISKPFSFEEIDNKIKGILKT